MRVTFDQQLQQLNEELTYMGALCETAIASAARALWTGDVNGTDLEALRQGYTPGDLVLRPASVEDICIGAEAGRLPEGGVTLHIVESASSGRLDGAKIRARVPDWSSASFWFCGPSAFAQALRQDFVRHGIPSARFHHELFEMR